MFFTVWFEYLLTEQYFTHLTWNKDHNTIARYKNTHITTKITQLHKGCTSNEKSEYSRSGDCSGFNRLW
ncbi:hypothetical protein VCHA51O444_120192 [Vibrio chagasii]|nr:hypothetical protein VCHA51O444_120192 [Vibrio chagasii]